MPPTYAASTSCACASVPPSVSGSQGTAGSTRSVPINPSTVLATTSASVNLEAFPAVIHQPYTAAVALRAQMRIIESWRKPFRVPSVRITSRTRLRAWQGALDAASLPPAQSARVRALAASLVTDIRAARRNQSGLDAFLLQYSLSSKEGVILLCLAESLLRIPRCRHRRPPDRREDPRRRLGRACGGIRLAVRECIPRGA